MLFFLKIKQFQVTEYGRSFSQFLKLEQYFDFLQRRIFSSGEKLVFAFWNLVAEAYGMTQEEELKSFLLANYHVAVEKPSSLNQDLVMGEPTNEPLVETEEVTAPKQEEEAPTSSTLSAGATTVSTAAGKATTVSTAAGKATTVSTAAGKATTVSTAAGKATAVITTANGTTPSNQAIGTSAASPILGGKVVQKPSILNQDLVKNKPTNEPRDFCSRLSRTFQKCLECCCRG